ncbi:hypothetical protein ACFVR6_07410 [Microbacterium sp. NPDC058021]|uniref:hypothetical protein n=1 Tax=Microbacterium sp. NPDC058021 TaxID=3346306 RepID=UPI0036DB8AA7
MPSPQEALQTPIPYGQARSIAQFLVVADHLSEREREPDAPLVFEQAPDEAHE